MGLCFFRQGFASDSARSALETAEGKRRTESRIRSKTENSKSKTHKQDMKYMNPPYIEYDKTALPFVFVCSAFGSASDLHYLFPAHLAKNTANRRDAPGRAACSHDATITSVVSPTPSYPLSVPPCVPSPLRSKTTTNSQ